MKKGLTSVSAIANWLGARAFRGIVRRAGEWIRTCHWVWLLVGVFLGWPIDWLFIWLQGMLNLFGPIFAPMIVDAILGPINEALVAFVPMMCLLEMLRRCHIFDDDEE